MEDFRVGAIALAWDGDSERVIIEAQELSDEPIEPLTEDLPEDGPAILRVTITAAAARAFARRALQIVSPAAAVPAVRAAARRRAGTSARVRTDTGLAATEPVTATGADRSSRKRQPPPAATADQRGRRAHRAADGRRARDRRTAGRGLQRDLYCTSATAIPAGRLRLQAGGGGAAAVGFPARHAGRPRGRRLPGLARLGLGHRPADRVPGRPVRPGHVPAVDRRRPVDRPGRAGPAAAATTACGRWRSSTR